MRLIATDFYALHRPSRCNLRVYLQHQRIAGEPRSAFEELIERLGQRHEATHLASFPAIVDLRDGELDERRRRTVETVTARATLLYQPVLASDVELDGIPCNVIGQPDFLILDGEGYLIRDSKLARRINPTDHLEIIAQMSLYGWLFERTFGTPPRALQVHSGSEAIVPIDYDGGALALRELRSIVTTRRAAQAPYSPVGWTKCGDCEYKPRCWRIAEENHDIARVAKIDQPLALALREQGVTTPELLLERFDELRLGEFQRPWGQKQQRVGKQAGRILAMARVLVSGTPEILHAPQIPEHSNYVMFDLEGLPPFLDELDKIYLWGTKVYGTTPSAFSAAVAGFGAQGDAEGWLAFLERARGIFGQYGDLPFVHWHHYERTKLTSYLARYGDRDGIGERVKQNLIDLLPITETSVALPVPSYSLKVIEKYVGFQRSLEEGRGDWAMATFIEATETEDAAQREALLSRIRAYNEEDLDAMWTVFQWLSDLNARQ